MHTTRVPSSSSGSGPAPALQPKKVFDDVHCSTMMLSSSWQSARANVAKKSIMSQTAPELYVFEEREVQSGRYTRIVQDQITEPSTSLLTHLCTKHTKLWPTTSSPEDLADRWRSKVQDGFVSVDCEVATDETARLDAEAFVEFVDARSHAGTQTEPLSSSLSLSTMIMAEPKTAESKESRSESKRERAATSALLAFLNRVTPSICEALDRNEHSTAFDQLEINENTDTDSDTLSLSLWKSLSVDLERKRVVYPDWTRAPHHLATVLRCTTTRNKERVYEVEYEDGGKLSAVREEHIRLLDDDGRQSRRSDRKPVLASRLQEGVRVHARVLVKVSYLLYEHYCSLTPPQHLLGRLTSRVG
jgi:hypothetical protein